MGTQSCCRIFIAGIKPACKTDAVLKLLSCKTYSVLLERSQLRFKLVKAVDFCWPFLVFLRFLSRFVLVAWLSSPEKGWEGSAFMVDTKVSKLTPSANETKPNSVSVGIR